MNVSSSRFSGVYRSQIPQQREMERLVQEGLEEIKIGKPSNAERIRQCARSAGVLFAEIQTAFHGLKIDLFKHQEKFYIAIDDSLGADASNREAWAAQARVKRDDSLNNASDPEALAQSMRDYFKQINDHDAASASCVSGEAFIDEQGRGQVRLDMNG